MNGRRRRRAGAPVHVLNLGRVFSFSHSPPPPPTGRRRISANGVVPRCPLRAHLAAARKAAARPPSITRADDTGAGQTTQSRADIAARLTQAAAAAATQTCQISQCAAGKPPRRRRRRRRPGEAARVPREVNQDSRDLAARYSDVMRPEVCRESRRSHVRIDSPRPCSLATDRHESLCVIIFAARHNAVVVGGGGVVAAVVVGGRALSWASKIGRAQLFSHSLIHSSPRHSSRTLLAGPYVQT